MKTLRKKIDIFCYRHPNFGIPRLMLALVAATALVYFISLIDSSKTFQSYLAFRPDLILKGQVWRLISWLIVPDSSSFLLLIALYFYYYIGSTLESVWGNGRFTIFYIMGVLLTVIIGMLSFFIYGIILSLVPYYLNMSMFFAFATLFPDKRVLLFFIIPIKVKWLAIIDALLIFVPAIINAFSYHWLVSLLPIVAVVNYLLFCGSDLQNSIRHISSGATSNVISFNKATKKVSKSRAGINDSGYKHKCSVCGRTDTEFPSLEFRYCSRCTGYHCFCADHINNHIHFTD